MIKYKYKYIIIIKAILFYLVLIVFRDVFFDSLGFLIFVCSILGNSMNLLVMFSNNWKMPVKIKYFRKTYCHCKLTKKTKFPCLSDIIPLNFKYFGFMFSVGDIFLILGMCLIFLKIGIG